MTHPQTLARLLSSPRSAGVFAVPDEVAHAVFDAAREAQLNVWRIDVSHADTASNLLSLLGHALHFPDWYGNNWDALADCLADLSWCEADGHILLIRGIEKLQRHEPSAYSAFVQLLRDTSLLWSKEGTAFWALFEGTPDGLETLPFSA